MILEIAIRILLGITALFSLSGITWMLGYGVKACSNGDDYTGYSIFEIGLAIIGILIFFTAISAIILTGLYLIGLVVLHALGI